MSQALHASQEYQALVYPPSIPQHSRNSSHLQSPLADSSWHSATHHSPPNSSASSTSQMYSVENRSADHLEYSSSSASAQFLQNDNQQDAYSGHEESQAMHASSSNPPMPMSFTQVHGSIGPDRGRLTRGRAAQLRKVNMSLQGGVPNDGLDDSDRQHTMYFMSSSISRPQTPSNVTEQIHYQQAEHLALNLGTPVALQSPAQFPSMPSSASPAYSSYGFYNASRSASGSISNPRSASPATSVASALTSISSSASAPNSSSQPFVTFPPPPPTTGRSPIPPRQKHRKQRLFNVDRKAICIYHKENPNARQEDIAARYGVERSTISKILKHKTKWMNVPEDEHLRVAKHRPSKFPEIEEQLVKWLIETKQSQTLLTDALIRAKAKETARSLHISDEKFKASSGWVENFKHRHGIRRGVWQDAGKNTRVARALGAGVLPDDGHDTILSPLNPAFDSRMETMSHGDLDVEVEEDLESEDDDSPAGDDPSMLQANTAIPLQPSWQPPSEPPPTMHVHAQSGSSAALMHDHPSQVYAESAQHQQHQQQHEQAAMHVDSVHQTVVVHDSQPAMQSDNHLGASAAAYAQGLALYQQPVPQMSSGLPTIEEVEDAVDKVIVFVDAHVDLISQKDRDILQQIRYAIFQAASGVPFMREDR